MAAPARELGGRKEGGGGTGWLLLIGGGLLAVGLYTAGWQVAPTVAAWARARSWIPVEATLSSVALDRSHAARRPTTREVRARYRYEWSGRTYESDRVALDRGKDNVGDYHLRMFAWLKEQARRNRTVTAWVDPANPADALLDREMRWGLLALKAVFATVFAALGGLFVIAGLRSPPPAGASNEPPAAQPWLARADWRNARVAPQARRRLRESWTLAGLVGAASIPLLLALPREWSAGNWPAALGLLFPLAAGALLVDAFRRTLEWRRFGEAALELDPFPGAIGGDFGAAIVLPGLPRDAAVDVRLSCVRSRVERSSGRRRVEEDVVWSATSLAGVQPGSTPARLAFRFELPAGLPASDLKSPPGVEWRLRLTAPLPGADLDRVYVVPVFPTATRSRGRAPITGPSAPSPRSGRIEFGRDGAVLVLRQPAFRAPWSAAIRAASALASGFAAWRAELAAVGQEETGGALAGAVLAAMLGLLAATFAWSAVWRVGHARTVRLSAAGAAVEDWIFGMRWRRRERATSTVRGVEVKSTFSLRTGERWRAWRRVALIGGGRPLTIADGLPDEAEARLVEAAARSALGLGGGGETIG